MITSIYGCSDLGLIRKRNEDTYAICLDIDNKVWTDIHSSKMIDTRERSPQDNNKVTVNFTLANSKQEPKEVYSTLTSLNPTSSSTNSGKLLLVADGMGGQNSGHVASFLAIRSIKECFDEINIDVSSSIERENFLRESLKYAHSVIVENSHEAVELVQMGTTIVATWIVANQMHVSWVGDSRCYLYDSHLDELHQLTEDHSMVWLLVKNGTHTPEQAHLHPNSNLLTMYLGQEQSIPEPGLITRHLSQNLRVLLCTDGLFNLLSNESITSILRRKNSTEVSCKQLIKEAIEAGGYDNITCILCDVTSH